MASEIRVNQIQNRSGLSTVTFTDTGLVISGITTISGSLNVPGGTTISAGSTSAPSISPVGDSNTGIFFPSADTVCIGEGGSEVIRVDSSGNVGINSTIPRTRLDVGGTILAGRTNSSDEGGEIAFCKGLDNSFSWSIDVYGNTSTPNLRFIDSTAGLVRMSIDGSGRVQMPYQPAFNAQGTGTLAFSGAQGYTKITIATNIAPNTSSSYSSSRFTAPVSGNYLFFLSSATSTATSSGPAILLYKNGVATQEIAINYTNAFYSQFGGSIIRSAVPGDYFEFYISNYNGTSFTIDLSRTYFGGYLIG